MGFQGSGESKMLGLIVTSSRHKRSKSFPDKKRVERDGLGSPLEAATRIKLDMRHLKDSVKTQEKQSPTLSTEVQNSLKQEILQLEKILQDQFEVRRALETALGYRTSYHYDTNETSVSITKQATELIKEIAVLELEVVYLEQHLLSLYRKAFDQQVSSISPPKRDERLKSTVDAPRERFSEVTRPDDASKVENSAAQSRYCDNSYKEHSGIGEEKLLDSGVHRCHSSLSQCSVFSSRTSPPDDTLAKAVRACHSQDLSMEDQHDIWSPGFRNNSSFDVRLDNPFHVEGLKEFSGPYSTMVEVSWIFRDSQKLGDVEHLLQNFRLLICQLEEVDPRKLKHEEKLAFWINIHNSLVMHAFLAHGIPQNNVKRLFLLLRAAYSIGGHTISADTIQSSILGCRMPRPGQWLRLFISRAKFKTGNERQAYAIEHPEPLLHFALCSGNHSDPAVRAYTPKRVYQELETAKEEYIRATFGVRKDKKILLPKIVESFAKDSSLCPASVIKMIQQSLPESLRRSVRKCQLGKSRKIIEWIPHNFTLRYLISKELVR
ncbi:uncharacterized protein LOC111317143 isoform X3 [Durio zibethinus]|uniref:Uncharacterized protein LOC111317143 isoform X3 n=1 Tax=Durio zibethinus TaxID=66656 RepID=A0A6P6BDS2_DURZI|nr:uncharacterized protein LOC111317143 isoform X3 [Durio zibethinus]